MQKSYKKVDYDVLNWIGEVEYSDSWCYEYQLQGLKSMLKSYNMTVIIK